MKKNIKNQKGAISLFVLLSMMFFMAFMLGAFTLVNRRNATQVEALAETQKIYSNKPTASEQYDSIFVKSGTSVVPITNIDQLKQAQAATGTNKYKYLINGKVYTYEAGAEYVLQNDIILDFEDTIHNQSGLNSKLYDYVLYSSSYNINLNGHSIYYQMNDNSLWKLVWYQNVSTTSNVLSATSGSTNYYGKSYGASTFSIMEDGITPYSHNWGTNLNFEFLLAYNNGTSNKFDITSSKLYNRWRQTNDPTKEARTTTTDSSVAAGYTHNFTGGQAILADYTGAASSYASSSTYSYWGGLQKAVTASKCYLDGSIGNSESYFQVGVATLTSNKIPATSSSNVTEGLLFVRYK